MKIGIVSDLHLDFFVELGNPKKLEKQLETIITEKIDVLVIAGDISHYNSQTFELCRLVNERGVKVVLVVGNHDHYIVSREQLIKYPQFLSRFQDLKERFQKLPDSHLLDGTTVTIDGITFGGACGWYDGTLSNPESPYGTSSQLLWEFYFNDSRRIPKLTNYLDMFQIENPKVLEVYQKCDVMVTHICPIADDSFIAEEFKGDILNGFYSFDGEHLVEASGATHWIYGHMHTSDSQQLMKLDGKSIDLIRNPYGYPGLEASKFKLKVIEV